MREKLEYTQQELVKANRRAKRARDTTAKVLQEMNDLKKLTDQANEMLENYKDIPINLFEKPSNEYTEDQRWLSNIDSTPGFSVQVLNYLKEKVQNEPLNYAYCTIMVDAMSIRKQIEWDPKLQKMTGFVDLGSGSIDSDTCEAREALVILAVGTTGNWKIPLGYFLIDGISADVHVNSS